jgi:hypothetical protein
LEFAGVFAGEFADNSQPTIAELYHTAVGINPTAATAATKNEQHAAEAFSAGVTTIQYADAGTTSCCGAADRQRRSATEHVDAGICPRDLFSVQ